MTKIHSNLLDMNPITIPIPGLNQMPYPQKKKKNNYKFSNKKEKEENKGFIINNL